jgi:hypothetical protein
MRFSFFSFVEHTRSILLAYRALKSQRIDQNPAWSTLPYLRDQHFTLKCWSQGPPEAITDLIHAIREYRKASDQRLTLRGSHAVQKLNRQATGRPIRESKTATEAEATRSRCEYLGWDSEPQGTPIFDA